MPKKSKTLELLQQLVANSAPKGRPPPDPKLNNAELASYYNEIGQAGGRRKRNKKKNKQKIIQDKLKTVQSKDEALKLLKFVITRFHRKRKAGKAKATKKPAQHYGDPTKASSGSIGEARVSSAAQQAEIYKAVADMHKYPEKKKDEKEESTALVPASQVYRKPVPYIGKSGKSHMLDPDLAEDLMSDVKSVIKKKDAELTAAEKKSKEKDDALKEKAEEELNKIFAKKELEFWNMKELKRVAKKHNLRMPQSPSIEKMLELIANTTEYDDWRNRTNLQLGRGLTNSTKDELATDQIDKLMSKFPEYQETVARDEGLPMRDKDQSVRCWIKNLDVRTGKGFHWVAIIINPKEVCYMDPFGTPAPADIVAQMLNALSPKAMANREFKQNTVKRQNLSSSRCGWHCILFLTKMLSGKSFEEATGMKALSETAKAEKETENFEKRNMGQIGGSFVDKLLDSGHLPELHLWTPWSGKHNFTGPGTKIWERVDKVTRKPKKGSEPVNAVDAISLTHDLAYEDHKDPAKRKQADVDMINSLNGVIASGNWREKLDAHITKAAIRTKQMLGLGIEPWLRPGYKPKISTLSKEKISTS